GGGSSPTRTTAPSRRSASSRNRSFRRKTGRAADGRREAGLSPALVEVEARVGCAKASCPARGSSAPAARQPDVRIRFQGVHALEGRGRREARGAEEAVLRSAL